jgi:hypothetical protein
VRASDVEREAAIDDLRRHAVAGRLDAAELEQRIDAAFAARTRADLDELRRDLPAPVDTGFGEHLRVYLAVQALLIAIWAVTGAGYFWPIWPLLGWGIGVVVHGICDSGTDHAWPSGTKKARRRPIAS